MSSSILISGTNANPEFRHGVSEHDLHEQANIVNTDSTPPATSIKPAHPALLLRLFLLHFRPPGFLSSDNGSTTFSGHLALLALLARLLGRRRRLGGSGSLSRCSLLGVLAFGISDGASAGAKDALKFGLQRFDLLRDFDGTMKLGK